jgi:hypothetical protein
VIRGGAYSAEELQQALESDAVAARHYAVFQRASVRPETSRFAEPVYVSYRKGDEVFWTRHAVTLPRGETLLTDGANYARARCGNRVSLKPQAPVEAQGPAPETLEHLETPDSGASTPEWREALLVAEVYPAYFPETPAQTAAMMAAILGESQPGIGYRFLAAGGDPIPFQSHPAAKVSPAPPSAPPQGANQTPPIPAFFPGAPVAPLACCFMVTPPAPMPGTSPEISPDAPLPASLDTPPYGLRFAISSALPYTSTYTTPATPPSLAPNAPFETPLNTPPGTPLNTPPYDPDAPPVSSVPEPGSLLAVLAALAAGVATRRRLRAGGR